jgi:23S rRNA (uracil-5-)-methyltransferase RumA
VCQQPADFRKFCNKIKQGNSEYCKNHCHYVEKWSENMKKGQIVEGVVERVEFPNKGIVQVEEHTEQGELFHYPVTVKGVLPGQKVKVSIKKARKNKCQGILREVSEPSELEKATPACPYFGTCGGCNYQTLPYENQLELKKQQVLDLLEPVCQGISDFEYDGIFPSPSQWAYRNKMEFSFGDEVKDGPLTLGLHKKNSFHDIISVSGCQIIHRDYSLILDCVREFSFQKGMSHYKKTSHQGILRHLLVRRGEKTGELLVALVTSSQYREKEMTDFLQELSEKLQHLPLEGNLTGFLHIINDSPADVVQSDATHIIYGKDWFQEEILGLWFRITPFSFFQTNTKGAELLYQKAREYVLNDGQTDEFQNKVVYDLYSGTGTIAQILAPIARKVIGVEIVEEAVEAARENAARNHLDNCEFIAGDVLKILDQIEEPPDYIVLDPPRDGIHPKALKKIISYGVPSLVYISCKPISLARDLAVMQEAGYRVERMCNVDMFPNTVHVETIVQLSQRKPDDRQSQCPMEKEKAIMDAL